MLFDPLADKISELVLPLEALELIEEVDKTTLQLLQQTILEAAFLRIEGEKNIALVKPKNIANRGGNYFLRAYDYLNNKIDEIEIVKSNKFIQIATPFEAKVPEFNIEDNPESATQEYIIKELIQAIEKAEKGMAFIRFKYKNRNDQLSYRTLKKYKVITVKEEHFYVSYLIGFCCGRQAKRNFRIDRIQNLQILLISYN